VHTPERTTSQSEESRRFLRVPHRRSGVAALFPGQPLSKVNLIPESVTEIRVVDIVGLDKQADGGTHVASTGEVGRFEVVKTESKGKGNKRLRIRLHDA